MEQYEIMKVKQAENEEQKLQEKFLASLDLKSEERSVHKNNTTYNDLKVPKKMVMKKKGSTTSKKST